MRGGISRPVGLKASSPEANPGIVGAAELRRIADLARPIKERIRFLLDLAPGQRILDVGCGPGHDVSAVARRMRARGMVVGVDYDATMVRTARDDARRGACETQVAHLQADAAGLPFATESFDRCYSERLLQHTVSPDAVMSEIARVTKRGGVVVVADADWATLSIDTPFVHTERSLVRFAGDTLRSGYAGRRLRGLLSANGFAGVLIEVWPIVWTSYTVFRATSLPVLNLDRRAIDAGVVTAAELSRFYGSLEDADRENAFFASAAVVVAVAERPRISVFAQGNAS